MDLNSTNTSENHEELLPKTHQEPFNICAIVLLTITLILIVTLNPLCLVVLRRVSGIQETTKLFMMSLTMCDLCTGVFCGIPELTNKITQIWVLGDFLCAMSDILDPTFFTINILSLLLLTIDRFIAIVHSLHYPSLMTPKRAKVIVSLVWILTLTIYVTGYVIIAQVENQCGIDIICSICNYVWIGMIGIPLAIILVLYVYILKVARHQARCIAAQNNIGNNPGEQNAPQRISTKCASTVFIITGAVFLAWTPAIIIMVLALQDIIVPSAGIVVVELLLYSNSWLNVVIYYLRNREFKQALHNLVSSRPH